MKRKRAFQQQQQQQKGHVDKVSTAATTIDSTSSTTTTTRLHHTPLDSSSNIVQKGPSSSLHLKKPPPLHIPTHASRSSRSSMRRPSLHSSAPLSSSSSSSSVAVMDAMNFESPAKMARYDNQGKRWKSHSDDDDAYRGPPPQKGMITQADAARFLSKFANLPPNKLPSASSIFHKYTNHDRVLGPFSAEGDSTATAKSGPSQPPTVKLEKKPFPPQYALAAKDTSLMNDTTTHSSSSQNDSKKFDIDQYLRELHPTRGTKSLSSRCKKQPPASDSVISIRFRGRTHTFDAMDSHLGATRTSDQRYIFSKDHYKLVIQQIGDTNKLVTFLHPKKRTDVLTQPPARVAECSICHVPMYHTDPQFLNAQEQHVHTRMHAENCRKVALSKSELNLHRERISKSRKKAERIQEECRKKERSILLSRQFEQERLLKELRKRLSAAASYQDEESDEDSDYDSMDLSEDEDAHSQKAREKQEPKIDVTDMEEPNAIEKEDSEKEMQTNTGNKAHNDTEKDPVAENEAHDHSQKDIRTQTHQQENSSKQDALPANVETASAPLKQSVHVTELIPRRLPTPEEEKYGARDSQNPESTPNQVSEAHSTESSSATLTEQSQDSQPNFRRYSHKGQKMTNDEDTSLEKTTGTDASRASSNKKTRRTRRPARRRRKKARRKNMRHQPKKQGSIRQQKKK